MKKLLITNWKMNIDCKRGALLAKKIVKKLKRNSKKDFILLPSLQSINFIKQKLSNKFLNLGAQDCSQFSVGAYTGDVSAAMIKELGCKYVLIGHSERRTNYNENNLVLTKKLQNAFIKSGIQMDLFWKPLHLQKPYIKFKKSNLNNTHSIWKKVVVLPSHPGLANNQQKKIIETITK